MFYRKYIEEALKITRESGNSLDESSAISKLIFDIFGGEIMKTQIKNGWHFFNRIDGECIDFERSAKNKFSNCAFYENQSSTLGETYNYLTEEDYSSFFTRFVRSFEEVVWTKKMSIDKGKPVLTDEVCLCS
jgi:hypothetical protein